MKLKIKLVLLGAGLLSVVVFQNCGNIKVEQKILSSVEPEPQAKSLPKGEICSGTGARFGTPVRFTFIVDMSLSNLGGSLAMSSGQEGKYIWTLKLNEATDKDFLRFTAMEKFISTCGNAPEFKYSVIGFSDAAMFPFGKNCNSPYGSAAAALTDVTGFRQIQAGDISVNGTMASFSPFVMGDTAYSTGLQCLETNIMSDASTSNTDEGGPPIYQTFFLTDGQPTDFAGNKVEQISKYTQTMNNIMFNALSLSSGIKMKTIYYGPEAQKANAKEILDVLAQSTGERLPDPNFPNDPTRTIAPTTLEIANFDSLSDQLCELYKPQATYAYRPYQQNAINLNRVEYSGKYESDTDADGLADLEEEKLGFNSFNPRTNGILDSLCVRAGFEVSNCQKPASCTEDVVGFGLTNCDIQFASTYFGKSLSGYDTDGDQIIDFIEIIRGTNPVKDDMQYDLDRDGITNIKEVLTGSSVTLKSEANVDDNIKFSWGRASTNSGCTDSAEEKYQYEFFNIPFVMTEAYSGQLGSMDFSHNEKENIYLMINLTEPRGTTLLLNRLNIIKIVVSTEKEPIVGPVIKIGEFAK